MKKKAIEMIPFGKEKIHKLDDCFMIDGKLIDRKTNNINVRICLRENAKNWQNFMRKQNQNGNV